ncbi:hypothetical protein CHS0354_014893 [Potamilus streckersoni]|uniref:Uncharacterized protein n=1 Tax=Potamilus streckersoni TaxID=2493646 RepID=A0AAE0RU21_9BIVA|nr:hypothetical protein CHS0354_014893 [Potamilus streckersoni]
MIQTITFVETFDVNLVNGSWDSNVGRSTTNTSSEPSKVCCENKAAPSEQQTGNYWTIVSNARGELTTAIDADNAQCIIQSPPGINDVLKKKNLKHSKSPKVDIELEEYLEPIHSDVVEHDDYIHPINSG